MFRARVKADALAGGQGLFYNLFEDSQLMIQVKILVLAIHKNI